MKTIFTPIKRATILGCVVLLASCGGGGDSPQPTISSPPPSISIAFDGGASGSVAQGQSIALSVTVANDPSGQGVSWVLDGVGALSHQTGTTVEYDAPVTLSSTVTATVTARVVSDPRKSAAKTIAVTPLPVAFTETGSMSVARFGHAATLLLDGRVLVTGGLDQSGPVLTSAELYDPLTGLFAPIGNMTLARHEHTATLLANATLPNYGKVLIAGGDSGGTEAELYDPVAGTFAATGSMAVAHVHGPTATLLKTGKVLLAGGDTPAGELYDPATGTFSTTGNMTAVRGGHTATLLIDGRVLVTGGGVGGSRSATAELYDPVAGTFTVTGSMAALRGAGHTATRLHDGTVLVVGTGQGVYAPPTSPEIYDPVTGLFTSAGDQHYPVGGNTASLRADGTVLIAGGYYYSLCGGEHLSTTSSAMAVLYSPGAHGFKASGGLITARAGHTATVLADGSVLVVGGTTGGSCQGTEQLSSAEVFH